MCSSEHIRQWTCFLLPNAKKRIIFANFICPAVTHLLQSRSSAPNEKVCVSKQVHSMLSYRTLPEIRCKKNQNKIWDLVWWLFLNTEAKWHGRAGPSLVKKASWVDWLSMNHPLGSHSSTIKCQHMSRSCLDQISAMGLYDRTTSDCVTVSGNVPGDMPLLIGIAYTA